MKHTVVRVKFPKVGKITAIKLGSRHYPAVKVVAIKVGDTIYDAKTTIPPITVKVIAIAPVGHSRPVVANIKGIRFTPPAINTSHSLYVRGPRITGIEVRDFHPSSYVPVPMGVFRKHHGGSVQIPARPDPAGAVRKAASQARSTGQGLLKPISIKTPNMGKINTTMRIPAIKVPDLG